MVLGHFAETKGPRRTGTKPRYPISSILTHQDISKVQAFSWKFLNHLSSVLRRLPAGPKEGRSYQPADPV